MPPDAQGARSGAAQGPAGTLPSGQLEITLLQERSAGTFARVYLAEARGGGGLSRVVAVKVIKEQWSDSAEILTRTRDEARLLARLQHKNILRVEALAQVDGQPAIVMEFVDGIDLQQLIERLAAAGRRAPRRALYKILHDTTSALEAAWEGVPLNMSGPLRVVHRDVKPSNVMISRQGEVKVLDFGTARFDFTERQAQTGAMRFGSLKYMSPERRQGDRGDHASDVYSLGLVALELLKGELLPVLPVSPQEHDEDLTALIGSLGDLGLPDDRWDDALRQTLAGMVAADPARRLHASQLTPLFRSFADAATGESLDAFAASTVAQVTREVYGSGPTGDLSGSRVFVALSTSADGTPPVTDLAEVPAGGSLDEVPPGGIEDETQVEDPGWGDVDRPTQVSVSITDQDRATQALEEGEYEPPTEVGGMAPPRRTEGGAALPVSAAPPEGFPGGNSTTRPQPPEPAGGAAAALLHDAAAPGSPASGSPASGSPASGSAALDTAPPGSPAPRSELRTAIIAGTVVFLLGGLLISIAGAALGMWWYFGSLGPEADARDRPEEPDSSLAAAAGAADGAADEAADEAAPEAGGGAAAADSATLDLSSDDEMLQWLAVEDAAGTRLFKGDPGGAPTLAPGEYLLVAKVRARSKASATLAVDGPLTLDCQSADEGEVHCTGDRDLVLVP